MKLHEPVDKHQAPLGYLVSEVSRLFKRRFEDLAKAHGITLPQWRALAQIAMHENITQREIATSIDADPMTISGILDRMEKRGFIQRFADPSDSRAKIARLTPEGEAMFAEARAVGLRIYEAAIVGLTEDERSAAQTALHKMRDNLTAQPAELEEA